MTGVNYAQSFDRYWQRSDHKRSHSFSDPMVIVRAIMQVTGPTRVLDVGTGMGGLVLALLRSGCDAQGIDVSDFAVEQANINAPGRYSVASALDLPFADDEFPTVVSANFLEHFDEADVAQVLKEMWRVCSDTLFLRVATTQDRDNCWHLTVQPRVWWEEQLIRAGFRKHPMQLDVIGYDEIETEGDTVTLVMQKIPLSVGAKYPLEVLRNERQLHMDMTREPGRRSDAHIIRYKLARDFIRPGDTILDIACGLGYGAAMMSYGSGAARIIGVDNSEFAIDYAKGNFGSDPRLDFRCADGDDLNWLGDASVDYVVSMETLEHLPDPDKFLATIARVLKPAGRIFVSVPNMWVDEHGNDPNEHHLHIYDLAKLRAQLSAQFELEGIWEQTAGGAFKLPDGKRRVRKIALDAAEYPDPEWWLCLAIKSPLLSDTTKIYVETVHLEQSDRSSHVADFAAWYDNPYLAQGLVNRGSRLQDPAALSRLARKVAVDSAQASADRGAALCVLAYATLDLISRPAKDSTATIAYPEDPDHLARQISDYLVILSDNPHVRRWQISLAYVLGTLHSARGNLTAAEATYRRCVGLDPSAFSPLIVTKTLQASLALADIELARDDRDAALRTLRQAIERATTAIGSDWPNVIGSVDRPLTFGFLELADVCDLAAKCVLKAEALTRGWSKSFAGRRGRMAHQDRFDDLQLAYIGLQEHAESLRLVNNNLLTQCAELREANRRLSESHPISGEAAPQGIAAAPPTGARRIVRRLKELARRFSYIARTEGLDVAAAQTSLFCKIRLAHRMPYLRRVKYFATKFAEHARARGLRSALNRSADTIIGEVPFLRRQRARKATEAFDGAMDAALEPRRVLRQIDSTQPQFAMFVKDFHDGGLEKVVIDLALHFLRQGIVCPILVSGSAGRAAAHASSVGCDVRVFNGDVEQLAAFARNFGIGVVFTHHCYEGLEQLSRAGIKIVEVIHNAYHWQQKDGWLADLRARYVSGYIAVSDFVREYSISRLSIHPGSVRLIENGLSREGLIRPPLPRLAAQRRATAANPVLVHLANAHPQKNHVAIVDAFEIVCRSYPTAQLVFAGVVDDKTEVGRELLSKIANKGLDSSVRCVGPLGRRALSRLLAQAHVGLLPSMLEGFSIASLEYTYFGLPTVLSETGAARRLADAYQHVAIADNAALSHADLAPDLIEQRSKSPDIAAAPSIAAAIMAVLSEYDRYTECAVQAGLAWRDYSIEATGQRYLEVVKEWAQ